jgi:O-antigen ligase
MIKNLNKLIYLTFYEKLLLLFPVILILRPVVINIYLILLTFILIYEFFKNRYVYIFKEIWVLSFVLFILYTIFRGFFATDPFLAVSSGVSLIRFLSFSLFIFLCIPTAKNLDLILKFWIFILILLCLDTLIQYFFFKDIFGFPIIESNSRLSGPFGRHAIIGAYLSYISIPLLFYYFSNFKKLNFYKKLLLFFIYFLLFIIIALTGERLALIIFFFSSLIIFFFNFRLKNFFKLTILICIILPIIYYSSLSFNNRINQFYSTIKNISSSPWGRLYQSSYLVFKSNIFFGVGLKNYSIVCDTKIIDPLKHIEHMPQFCSTHPHHLYLEILSESGILGFLILFFTFGNFFTLLVKKIKKLKSNKVYIKYKGLLYGNILILLIYFWPIKTSGRFFTTWNGSFFWFNLGMILLITKDFYKIKNK